MNHKSTMLVLCLCAPLCAGPVVAPRMTSGTTAAVPPTGSPGGMVNVTDSTSGLPFYFYNAAGNAVKLLDVGPSGALDMSTLGQIDIVTSVVPRLQAANNFSGSNTFGGMTTLQDVTIKGNCTGCASGSNIPAGTAIGDIFVSGANGVMLRLGIGSAGQVLTVSTGGQPIWATPSSGSVAPSPAPSGNPVSAGATYSQLSTDSLGNLVVSGVKPSAADLTINGADAGNLALRTKDQAGYWFLSAYPKSYTNLDGDFAFYNAVTGKTPLRLDKDSATVTFVGDVLANRPACDPRHRGAVFFVQDVSNQNDHEQQCVYQSGKLTWKQVY